MRFNLLSLSVLATLITVDSTHAGEGMWVPQQLPEIAGPLKQAGLQLSPEQLSNLTGDPMGAVVSLGNCTASLVSPEGLVITNHHCAYGAIQLNSTPKKNLIKEGFNALTQTDEVSAGPNARIYVLEQITDVTAQAKAALAAAGNDPFKRTTALETFSKQEIAKCEAEQGYHCQFFSFAGGNIYRVSKNLEIKDLRLVYAPPVSVGQFGGEVDNWMWPRHTADFSFYRAYIGKDGKPASFSKENIPYRPKHWLKFSDQPLGNGDFVMVAGYPGRTNRYALVAEFENTAHWTYPVIGQHFKNLIALIEAAGKQNPEIQVKYAGTLAELSNVSKNFDGQLEGFRRIDAMGQKQREETAVLAWLKQQSIRGHEALSAYQTLVDLTEQYKANQDLDFVLGQFNGSGVIGVAVKLYRLAIERIKPDAQREAGYQERDLPTIEGNLKQMERRYVPAMDRQMQQYWLTEYTKLPVKQRVAAIDAWLGDGITGTLKRLDDTKLSSSEERLKWFKADRAVFESSQDPAIRYAVAIMPALLEIERQNKIRTGELLKARPIYLQALADYNKSHGKFVYPDANLSLRITFGHVKGYSPKDGVEYTPFTTLQGVMAKNTGVEPFDSPKSLIDAIKAKHYANLADQRIGTVPVNFLSDLEMTGGNSGSPVLDAHGKLVGLVFDGNWESVSSNWVFDPVMTRTIAVDSRYVQWIMTEVAPAPRLLKELNLYR